MAARWIGLSRSNKGRVSKRAERASIKHCMHAASLASVLVVAAAMNFALYPDALAAVVSGERQIIGFVPDEPSSSAVSPATPVALNEEEVRLLAATAWGEARSEGEHGMRAVAHVMVNRIGDRFGEDLATVILSPKQFSVWNRGDPNRRTVINLARDPSSVITDPEWAIADRVAREVLSGQSIDPTGGALFYHTRAVRPRWARFGEGRQIIGQHIFYADVPDPGRRETPRMIDVAQYLGQAISGGEARTQHASASARGPRAGRVNGVIQYASPEAAGQALPSESVATDVNAAATPTINGVALSVSGTTSPAAP
ncbi:cell wall hydrolase [Vitreimonas sp.]|uniref:cell wall hydrolase n=1 Tax=Vitreimonas sp. TaxID=3069702 RepID=UPI002ED8B7CB